MDFLEFIIFIVIFIFYFCFMVPKNTASVDKPVGPEPIPVPYNIQIQKIGQNQFEISSNRGDSWNFELEDKYVLSNNAFKEKDACFGKIDGHHVRARGIELYNHIRNQEVVNKSSTAHVLNSGNNVLKNFGLFYFICKGDKIDKLEVCRHGTVFSQYHCEIINNCTGKPDGYMFPNHLKMDEYIVCENGQEKLHQCPAGTVFQQDDCRPGFVCPDKVSSIKYSLDNNSYISCEKGVAKIEKCPENTFFIGGHCVSDKCRNQPDNSFVAHDRVKFEKYNFLSYHPGYFVCDKEIPRQSHKCSQYWDQTNADSILVWMPQVYNPDTRQCENPELCVNVFLETDHIAHRYHYEKHLLGFKYNKLYDKLFGYKCDQSSKQDFRAPEGMMIDDNGNLSSACTATTTKIPILNNSDQYYNCSSGQIASCAINKFFNGEECQDKNENAFKFENLDIFSVDGLSRMNQWISPFIYKTAPQGQPPLKKKNCKPGEDYIFTLNICAHPRCTKYPFLAQFPHFYIYIDDQSYCYYDEPNETIKIEDWQKTDTDRKRLNFNLQNIYVGPAKSEAACKFGQTVSSGNFLKDSVLYQTCDPNQPFVFCPFTDIIFKQISKVGNSYYCEPKNLKGTLKDNSQHALFPKEVTKIIFENLDAHLDIQLNKNTYNMPKMTDISENVDSQLFNLMKYKRTGNTLEVEILRKLNFTPRGSDVKVELELLQTYPYHVAYFDKTYSSYNENGSVILTSPSLAKFGRSSMIMDIPKHTISFKMNTFV